MIDLVDAEHNRLAGLFRDYLATYTESEDLINIGAYVEGTNPRLDEARSYIDKMQALLRQGIEETEAWDDSLAKLQQLFAGE
jgi:flagellar biosynthesis/type III secretory pathway ATPase